MCVKIFRPCFLGILLFLCSSVSGSGWKPIVPPADYYATMPTTCVSPDCNPDQTNHQHKYSHPNDAGETNVQPASLKSVWPKQTSASSSYRLQTVETNKDLIISNPKLDVTLYKPTKLAFYPQELDAHGKQPVSIPLHPYKEAYKKAPTSFIDYNAYAVQQKPAKTLYYGEPDLLKSKLTDDGSHYVAVTGQHLGSDNDLKASYVGGLKSTHDEYCTVYKVSFNQELYYQYVQYKTLMPDLKEFTICLWFRLHNHSHDHSLFSYAAKPHRKDIYMWVSNLHDPGQFSMKVLGQTIFRLYYPVKHYMWYHTCQSWNGNTGEWQVWVNSHRIGRGFHNLLVGHKIPGKGISISGQENKHFGKPFQEVPYIFKGSSGLLGEITMLQMYKVALTAGKAYTDHRHHHSHYTSTTPEPPEVPTEEMPTTTEHPLLENGQLKKHVNILELVEALKHKEHIDGLDDHHDHYPDHHHYEHHLNPHQFHHHEHVHGHHPDYHHSKHHHKHHHDHHHQDVEEYTSHLLPQYTGPVVPLLPHRNSIAYGGIPDHAVFKRDHAKGSESEETVRQRNKGESSESTSESDESEESSEKPAELPKKIKVFNKPLTRQVRIQKMKFPDRSKRPQHPEQSYRNSTGKDTQASGSESSESNEESSEEDVQPKRNVRIKKVKRIVPFAGGLRPTKHRTTRDVKFPVRGIITKKIVVESPKATIVKKMVDDKKKPKASKRFLHFASNLDVLGHGHYGPTSPASGYHHHHQPHTHNNHHHHHHHHDPYDLLPQFDDDDKSYEDDDNPLHEPESDEDSRPQHELAENEVRKVMAMCSGCHLDPFRKVSVISWKTTPKKIYSGALLLKAKPECENF